MWVLKRVSFSKTPFDLPLALLALSFLASSFFASPNRFLSLTSPLSTGTLLALTVLFFVFTNNFKREYFSILIDAVLLSASLLALLAIYQFVGVAEVLTDIAWLQAKNFTPAGGLLILCLFLAFVLPLGLSKVIRPKEAPFKGLVHGLACFLIISGLGVVFYQLVSTSKPIILPYKTGWAIAIETLKVSPLFGVGPENFLAAFTRFKIIDFNFTPYWNLKFGVSSNWLFQIITTTGVLGLLAFILLLWQVRKAFSFVFTKEELLLKSVFVSLILCFLMLLFLPVNLPVLYFTFLFLGLASLFLPRKKYEEESKILPVIFLGLSLPVIAISFYYLGKVFLADVYFKNSLDALARNDGLKTYNLQIKTITTNPNNDNYRVAYSQTNFALANSIASTGELSDQDRERVSVLIQQAIREAKAAVALNRQNVVNWENLAQLYQALVNFTQGAENWAISSYQTAISLDPFNPSLRINLGGIYYSLQRWDEAIRQFEIATSLKPDFANAHYNLAVALREKGDYVKASSEMETVLSLVEPGTGDFEKASSELEELRKKLGEEKEKEETKPPESLKEPEALPTTKVEPPIELPEEEAAPPEPENPKATPTPTPSPTPTLTPTPQED